MKKQSERLGTENPGKLLITLSTPAMIGMFVTALYNIADAIFIGRGVGTLGLAGVSIALPFQMLLMAFAGMVGMGGGSIISRRLGAHQLEDANKALGNVIDLVVIIGFLAAVCVLMFVEPLLRLIGATQNILPYAKDYLSIVLLGSVFFGFAMSTNNIVRAEGNARLAMLTMIFSAAVNLVLDPIFIFGFGWGVRGAALATIIAQTSAAAFMVWYFTSGRSSLTLSTRYLTPDPAIAKEIMIVGSPIFVRHSAGYVMFVIVNSLLVKYGGEVSVAVFGVVNRVLMVFLMPTMGIIQGMQPIVGYNYGARQIDRVKETVLLAVKYSTGISVAAFIIMMIFPSYLIRIFSTDAAMIQCGTSALRFIFAAAAVIGAQMVAGGFYQALGKANQALVLSMARQVLFFIPLVLITPHIWGLNGIWAAFPLADVCAFVLTAVMVYSDVQKGLFRPEIETDMLLQEYLYEE